MSAKLIRKQVAGRELTRSAEVNTSSANAEQRTIDVTFTTGFKGKRTGWLGDEWFEELAVDASAVRLDRLNAGGPLLDSHNSYGLKGVIGVVERAWIQDGVGVATVRFSKRSEVDPIWNDVLGGIIRNVSVGYRVYKWQDVTMGDDKVKTFRAVDWEPLEISFVPIGFDPGAQSRSGVEPFSTEVISPIGDKSREIKVSKRKNEADQIDDQPVVPAAAQVAETVDMEKVKREAVETERRRIADIGKVVRQGKLEPAFADDLIARGVSVDEARKIVLDKLADADQATDTKSGVRIEAGALDENKTRSEAIENAVMHRAFPGKVALTEAAREWRGMSLLEMARGFLNAQGISTKGMGKHDLAQEALKVRAGHSTSDFPYVLANVANKSLLQSYNELSAKQSFRPIVKVAYVPDFKQVSRVRLGEVPNLSKVPEGAEISYGTVGESKEVYNLATYAKIFKINREVLINDDLGAFSSLPSKYGAAAARLESDIVWAIFTANAAMGDGTTLFHSDHGNVGSSGAPSITTISEARKLMRKQKGVNAKDILNITPKYIIVPAALETTAEQFVSQNLLASASTSVNPFAGKLQVISEARLDANSATKWYMSADPAEGIDVIELAYLDGAVGPQVETKAGWEVNGVEIKALLDVGAKALDWRGLFYNAG